MKAALDSHLIAAVERHGGDRADALDLARSWERLRADRGGRMDRLRFDAAHPRCCCVNGGEPGEDGRCSRCWGERWRPRRRRSRSRSC